MTPIDPLILEDALRQPQGAVAYHLGRVLEEHAEGRAVLEIADTELDVDMLVDDGRATAEPIAGLHQMKSVVWRGRGAIEERYECSWLLVSWQGHALELVRLDWREGFESMRRHWILAADRALAERFAAAALDAVHLPARQVLVYSGACWSRDAELYRVVQQADWSDLILPGDTVQRIRDDIGSFLGARELYGRYGVPYKRGVLFTGPPGNGKTHCVRALMKEAALPTLYVRSFDARYGEVDVNIQSVFHRARRVAPCLLVLEDLDAIVKPANLSVFLNELDGVKNDTGILTLATTNHPDRLDTALLERPSRFDRKYHFELPGADERRRYLARWLGRLEPDMRVAAEVADGLADRCEGFSYAYLKELVVSAMVRWMREQSPGTMPAILDTELAHLRDHMNRPAAAPPPSPAPA